MNHSRLPAPFGDTRTLVLAGSDPTSRPQDPAHRRREEPLGDKAFLNLHGRLVIEYVLESLLACGLTRIWVLAPDQQLARIPSPHRFTGISQTPGARFFDNLATASAALRPADGEPVLLVFGDHPLMTPAALHEFLVRCGEQWDEADLFHALALESAYREFMPWFHRTSMHSREVSGRASGLTLAIPSRLHGMSVLQQLYGVRKLERLGSLAGLLSHLIRWLGSDAPQAVLDGVLLYLAKDLEAAGRGSSPLAATARRLESWTAARVPIRRLERYAARILGAERGVRLIPLALGGLAVDVDFAEEHEALERHWDALREITARQDAAIIRRHG